MKSILVLAVLSVAVLHVSCPILRAEEKRIPVVLIHGLFGWGRGEMKGSLYWGGEHFDVEAHLRGLGHPAHTASVGPLSSNHDRACELFAQILGGRVDYGEAHARRFGHERFGREHEGFHPDWSAEHPVHLVGHSLGGLTARALVQLLAEDHWGLGTSARWVRSVTTLSTPHNGSTLMHLVGSLGDGLVEKIGAAFLGLAGTRSSHLDYDCDLDQWGLGRFDGESLGGFLRRVQDAVGDARDLAPWSIDPDNAEELNAELPTHEDVTYLSWATAATRPAHNLWGNHVPDASMTMPIFKVCALYMGAYHGAELGGTASDWWPNDGQTNAISCLAPFGHARRDFDGRLVKGCWNVMGTVGSCDHARIIGCFRGPEERPFLEAFYGGLARHLDAVEP